MIGIRSPSWQRRAGTRREGLGAQGRAAGWADTAAARTTHRAVARLESSPSRWQSPQDGPRATQLRAHRSPPGEKSQAGGGYGGVRLPVQPRTLPSLSLTALLHKSPRSGCSQAVHTRKPSPTPSPRASCALDCQKAEQGSFSRALGCAAQETASLCVTSAQSWG